MDNQKELQEELQEEQQAGTEQQKEKKETGKGQNGAQHAGKKHGRTGYLRHHRVYTRICRKNTADNVKCLECISASKK